MWENAVSYICITVVSPSDSGKLLDAAYRNFEAGSVKFPTA